MGENRGSQKRMATNVNRGLAWIGIASSLVGILDIAAILIILNNWVSRTEYGIATLVVWMFPLLDQATDLGLSAAVIQRDDHDDSKISTVFWINFMTAVGMFAILSGIAPIVAHVYGHDIIGWMLVAYGTKLLMQNVYFIPLALMKRELRFKEYFRGAEYQDIALSDVGVHGPGLGTGERLGFRDINQLSKILKSIVVHAELSSDKLFVMTDGEYAEEELYTARAQYSVREITVMKRSQLDYLLVGLNDDRNLCLDLGIVREMDVKEQTLRLVTPCHDVAPVRHIALGSLRVNPAGSELGQW